MVASQFTAANSRVMRRPKRPWPCSVFFNSSSGTLPAYLRRRLAQKDAQAASCRQAGNVITRQALHAICQPQLNYRRARNTKDKEKEMTKNNGAQNNKPRRADRKGELEWIIYRS
jgi:hypothetical protein